MTDDVARAKAALVEAAARAFYAFDSRMADCWDTEEPGVRGWYRHGCADALAALREVRLEVSCPTCGGSGYNPASDGRFLCPDCDEPRHALAAFAVEQDAEAVIAELRRVGFTVMASDGPHYIDVDDVGWSIQHPPKCRPDLLGCIFHRCIDQHVKEYDCVMVDEVGRYSFVVDDDGAPTFTRALPDEVQAEQTEER